MVQVLEVRASVLWRTCRGNRFKCSCGVMRVQDLLPLLEGNLAARSQAVRGATLNLLCTCPQPPLPRQGAEIGSAPDEPQHLSNIFPKLAQIENQVKPSEPLFGMPQDLDLTAVPLP